MTITATTQTKELTASEIKEIALKITNEWNDLHYYGSHYIGIRFEDKQREIGEICECSRHNIDREDARDFPIYGTPEYDSMIVLDGTSAYNLETYRDWNDQKRYLRDHCYIIVGKNAAQHDEDDLDYGEIVICDAEVIAQIF